MGGVVLGLWVVQILGGAYLWSFTTGRGRAESRQSGLRTGQSPFLLFLHPLIGVAGLASWIGYMQQEQRGFAWVSFGLLVLGAVLGRLLDSRAGAVRMPRPVVVGHAVLAGALLVLVLLTALGVLGPIDEDEPPDGGTAAPSLVC